MKLLLDFLSFFLHTCMLKNDLGHDYTKLLEDLCFSVSWTNHMKKKNY